jgi:hypothetical protein
MSAKTPNEQVGVLHKAAADGLTFAKLLYLQWNLRCRVAEIGQVHLDTATGNHDILWVPSGEQLE